MIGVETLIAIAGQLISLVKSRKEHKEDVFSTFIEPLYVETEKIISDYLLIHQNVINALRQGQDNRRAFINAWGTDNETKKLATTVRENLMVFFSNDPKELEYLASADLVELSDYERDVFLENNGLRKRIKENFDKDRENLYHARVKVMEVANVYANSNLGDDIKKFANSIGNIFYLTDNAENRGLRRFTEARSVAISDILEYEKNENAELLKYLEHTVKEIRENWGEAIRQYAQLRIKSKQLR